MTNNLNIKLKMTSKAIHSKPYFLVVEEWNSPTESGRNVIGDFDTPQEAISMCRECASNEYDDRWFDATQTDPMEPVRVTPDWRNDINGYAITPKNGLDDWFYFCRVIEVNPFH